MNATLVRLSRFGLSLGMALVFAGAFALAAGTVFVPFLWATVAVFLLASAIAIATTSVSLMRERSRPAEKGAGAGILPVVLRAVIFATWVLAGLDVGRLAISKVPIWVQGAGLVGYAGSLALGVAVRRVNDFYSTMVRVQDERGHRVIDTGPYRWVRHPGYSGGVASLVFLALALGSALAVLPAAILLPFYVQRIRVEEAYLEERLPGYRDYLARVRFRLVPGVW